MMPNRKGAGRPNAATYVTSWGDTVEGAYKGKDGKLRPIGKARPAFSLSDEHRAVFKFKRWQSEQESDKPFLMDKHEDLAFYESPLAIAVNERERIRNLILSDPKQAAIELRIEHLEWYPESPLQPQFTLSELADFYCKNKRDKKGKLTHTKWQQNVRLAWEPTPKATHTIEDKRKRKKRSDMPKTSFLDVVQVQYARDIRQHHIRAYRDAILDEFTMYGHSGSWISTRYKAVKAILSFILEEAEEVDKPEFRRVKDLCGILKDPDRESNPSPIKPEHYRPLVDAAKPREKAILLIGLNCLMHSGEASQTLREDVSLEDGILAARRTKTRKPRIAKLWDRTVAAIMIYLQLYPNKSEHLFVTRNGTPMSGENMRQIVVRLRRKLKLPEYVTFEGIRDAGYQYAEEVDSERAKWIAGQHTGEKDSYILRQANTPRVRECCEAIEGHFFGGKNQDSGT